MQKELTNQAMALFDTPEKWNAFLDLVSEEKSIIYYWHSTLIRALIKRFKQEDPPIEKWDFGENRNTMSMTWHLKEFGKDSLAIWLLKYYTEFSLYVNSEYFDSDEVTRLLKTEEFSPLLSPFTQYYKIYQGDYKICEEMDYVFDNQFKNLNSDQLAWFAGNKTEDFVNQIAEKVDRFRKNEQLTKLLQKLNELTKK